MDKIFKYELAITDVQLVQIPSLARILSVHEQNGKLCMWAVVDPSRRLKDYNIMIFGTGNPVPEGLRSRTYAPSGYATDFIGTVQMSNGLVWHVFSQVVSLN